MDRVPGSFFKLGFQELDRVDWKVDTAQKQLASPSLIHREQVGRMKIFLNNISPKTTNHALKEFAEQAITPPWYAPFAAKGEIKSCAVLKIKDLDTGQVEFHGLVDIRPFKSAQLAIRKMNRLKFGGRYVQARQWHIRSYKADQRDPFRNAGKKFSDDRRLRDRRRPRLVVDHHVQIRIQGVKGFNRVYHD